MQATEQRKSTQQKQITMQINTPTRATVNKEQNRKRIKGIALKEGLTLLRD